MASSTEHLVGHAFRLDRKIAMPAARSCCVLAGQKCPACFKQNVSNRLGRQRLRANLKSPTETHRPPSAALDRLYSCCGADRRARAGRPTYQLFRAGPIGVDAAIGLDARVAAQLGAFPILENDYCEERARDDNYLYIPFRYIAS